MDVTLRRRPSVRAALNGSGFQRWVVLGILIGIGVGVMASVFLFAIDGMTQLFLGGIAGLAPPVPSGEGATVVQSASRPWLFPVVVALGGLLSAIIVYRLAPEAEGGGTDSAIRAFHDDGGHLRRRVVPVKLVASAIILGSGGSAGREGPSAQMGAGIASWIGEVFRLTPQDRRIACAVGLGAGIGAIFRAPLGGAILSAEILYIRDFEIEAIVPGLIASVIGYSIVGGIFGFTPIFGRGLGLRFEDPASLGWYALLGILAGLLAIAYARVFYKIRDGFRVLRAPRWLKPAVGGLAVGVIAIAFPQVLSIGYGWVQLAIEGNHAQLATWTMLALVGVKILTTSLTIGSGGAGGDFAPVLYVGAMLGGGVWGLLHGHVPGLPPTAAPFVIVGMMALLGGAAKAPLAVMIMVAEMTGEFSMIVPAMLAAGLAYLVSGDTTLYEEQRKTRADSPAHRGEFTIPLIQAVTVAEAMSRDVVSAAPSEPVAAAEQRMRDAGLRGMPVLEAGRLVGMFTASDALRAARGPAATVGDVMTEHPIVAHPGESLHTVLQRITRSGVSRLPVVEREAPDRPVGIVSMRDLAAVLDLEVAALAERPTARMSAGADDPLRSVLVRDAMRGGIECVTASSSLKRVANRLSAAGLHAAAVVDDRGVLAGVVTVTDIERSVDEDPARPVAEIAPRDVVVARPSQTVADALAQPRAQGLRQIVVVEGVGGELRPIGLLRRSDVVAAYLRVRDREARIARRARAIDEQPGSGAETLEVTIAGGTEPVGRTLAELRLPADAVITRIVRGGDVIIPRGSVRVEPGDRLAVLVAAGAADEVRQRFRDCAVKVVA
ncbi:MAG: chloride channel protein [Chloroflexota bacterium]|nr:chloride channel protein [Chloroflexota bacterium]